MTMMSYAPPPWVTGPAAARARAVRIRRCLILAIVMILVIIAGAIGL